MISPPNRPLSSGRTGRSFDWPFPLLYPLPAVLAAIPFAALTLRVADPLFVALGAFALAWALTRDRLDNPQLLVFVSLAYGLVIQTLQWAPLLCAAAMLPALGFLLACKPTLGLALLAAFPSRRAVLGASVFALAATALWPWWPREWLKALPAATQ